jgi:hypothetical protein
MMDARQRKWQQTDAASTGQIRPNRAYGTCSGHPMAVQRVFRKQQVLGSNPSVGSTFGNRSATERLS